MTDPTEQEEQIAAAVEQGLARQKTDVLIKAEKSDSPARSAADFGSRVARGGDAQHGGVGEGRAAMSIRFACSICGKKLKAPDTDAGRSTLCTGCGTKVRIPFADGSTDESVAHRRRPRSTPSMPTSPMRRPSIRLASWAARARHPEDLIDMTAMVDIVFFMLIFFMVASAQAIVAVMPMPPAQAQSGAAGKAKSAAELEAESEILTIRIEPGDEIWIDDEQVYGEMAIRTRLRNEKANDKEKRGVLVIGNADATHGAAVLVFDACMDAGYDDIRLSVQETKEEAE